jgi:hypothetical protein
LITAVGAAIANAPSVGKIDWILWPAFRSSHAYWSAPSAAIKRSPRVSVSETCWWPCTIMTSFARSF